MNLYRLGVCLKCRGDLAYDDGDWLCLQCGTYYYTGLYAENQSGTPGDGLLLLRPAQDGDGFSNYPATDGQLAPAAD